MSDAALELEYEQRLQAAARYLEVWVTYQDGRRIKRRTFMDTPEGRQSAAKNADTWMELPLVDRVEVLPVDSLGRSEAQGKAAGGGSPPAPAPAGTCEPGKRLCKPSPAPSGRLHHGRACPDQPGEPISAKSYVGAGRANPEPWKPRR